MEKQFQQVQEVVNLNLKFLETLKSLNLPKLNKDAKGFLLSQLKKTIGILGRMVIENDKL